MVKEPTEDLAHAMRTPLHTIKVFLDLLPEQGDDDMKELHAGAKRGVEQLLAIADKIDKISTQRS